MLQKLQKRELRKNFLIEVKLGFSLRYTGYYDRQCGENLSLSLKLKKKLANHISESDM